MKAPTREEILEHFKDAEIVESSLTGWDFDYIDTVVYLDYRWYSENEKTERRTLWTFDDGYSKIISRKTPKPKTKYIQVEAKIYQAMQEKIKSYEKHN